MVKEVRRPSSGHIACILVSVCADFIQALVQAKLGEKYFSICAATYGIAFFGTPHRGSPFARFGAIIAKITRTILRNPSNTFMTALKQNELYASELFSNFQQLVKSYQFLSFYETRSFKNLGLVSVGLSS